MTYEEWQFEFSKSTGIPYYYLKEVGDSWYKLLEEDELTKAINSPFKDVIDTKEQDKICEQYLTETEKRFSNSDKQMKKRFTI